MVPCTKGKHTEAGLSNLDELGALTVIVETHSPRPVGSQPATVLPVTCDTQAKWGWDWGRRVGGTGQVVCPQTICGMHYVCVTAASNVVSCIPSYPSRATPVDHLQLTKRNRIKLQQSQSATSFPRQRTGSTHHRESHAPVAEHGVGQQLGGSTHSDALAVVQLKQTTLQQQHNSIISSSTSQASTPCWPYSARQKLWYASCSMQATKLVSACINCTLPAALLADS